MAEQAEVRIERETLKTWRMQLQAALNRINNELRMIAEEGVEGVGGELKVAIPPIENVLMMMGIIENKQFPPATIE